MTFNRLKTITNLIYIYEPMKILFNNVLIRPNPANEIVLVTGQKLYLDTRFEEWGTAPQSGTVLAVPEKLRFSTDMKDYNSLDFKTTMELQVGDTVIFNYKAWEFARTTGGMVGDDFFVRYDSIYVVVRNNKVICINGIVIVEPAVEEIKTKLIVPDIAKDKKLKIKGTVIHAAERPHEQNHNNPTLNTMAAPMVATENGFEELGRFVIPGDEVWFHFANAIPLQHYHETNGTLSRKLLYRMQHSDIEIVTKKSEEPCLV